MRGRGETLLIVEDEEGIRSLLKELIAEAGYNVLEAKDGKEAITIFQQRKMRYNSCSQISAFQRSQAFSFFTS